MFVSTESRFQIFRPLEFSTGEVTGAIGDSITVLPLVVSLGLLTPASLPHLLVGFAVFQVVWGCIYGVPLSVEPMKALAGLAIAGGITYGELVAAGLLAGGSLLVAGRRNWLRHVSGAFGEPVVRGVQVAVACLLVVAAVDLVVAAPAAAGVGIVAAALIALVSRRAVALALLVIGGLWAFAVVGAPQPTFPEMGLFPTGEPTVSGAAIEGLTAQLAMTVGNAAIATSLLLSDLYDVDVSADRLAESMGVMNLIAVPFGALPMCHGSGGLAGKYAFGARTGTANIVAGALYLGLALVSGLLIAFPMALLGVLLLVVAASLARVALGSTDRPLFVVSIGGLAVVTNVGVAFVAGLVWWHFRG
ncbi:MAG: putative sulfate/molybdate transporter [Halobacteriota archaeon]